MDLGLLSVVVPSVLADLSDSVGQGGTPQIAQRYPGRSRQERLDAIYSGLFQFSRVNRPDAQQPKDCFS
jgi:hypothetical protein